MSQGFPPPMGSTKVLSVPQSHVHWESLGCTRDSHHQWALPRSCLSHSPSRSPRDVPEIPTTIGLYQGRVCPTVPQSHRESAGCPRDSHHHWPLPRSCLSHSHTGSPRDVPGIPTTIGLYQGPVCPTVIPGVPGMSQGFPPPLASTKVLSVPQSYRESQGFPPPLASTKVLSVPQSYRESPGCPRDSHHHWLLPRSCLSHSHTGSPRDVPGIPTTIGLYQGPVSPTVPLGCARDSRFPSISMNF